MSAYDLEEDPPLEPAQERLRRKLARLVFISGATMTLGLIAVIAAIVYKLNEGPTGEALSSGLRGAFSTEAEIAIPAGHRLVSTALDGDRALLTLSAADGSTLLLLVDLTSGDVLSRYHLAAP